MNELERSSIESSELIGQTFEFWFSGGGHIRSPFPDYIRPELKKNATDRFFTWASSLNEKAKDELNDEAIGEKFEEIIFESALALVKTEDERITILYPFLPRLGDEINDEDGLKSTIQDRMMEREGDNSFLKVVCVRQSDGKKWSTRFELPV